MGALARVEEAAELTEQQRKFVEALVGGASPEDAVRAAGYSDTIHHSVPLGSLRVLRAIRAACDAELDGTIRIAAMRKLRELVTDPKTPSATAFNAAKLIVERGDDKQGEGDKPLSQMDETELQALVSRLQERLEAGMVDVTPETGA